MLKSAVENAKKGYATNFGFKVKDPQRFGIMELDKEKNIISVEEKPEKPKSDFAITGLYFYPKNVAQKAKEVKPSKRGELEITTLNNMYLEEKKLKAELLGGGFCWFDTGTFESQIDAANTIRVFQNTKDCVIACLEQIGYDNGWITKETLEKRADLLAKNSYGEFLKKVLEEGNN